MSQSVDEYDYYGRLGIDRSADEAAIKAAYKKKSLEFHPDKIETQNAARFKKVAEAKGFLVDPGKKKLYDYLLDKYGNASDAFKARMKVCIEYYMNKPEIVEAIDKLAKADPREVNKFLDKFDERISAHIAQQNAAAQAPPPPIIIRGPAAKTSPQEVQLEIEGIKINISPSTLTIKFEGINLVTALKLSEAIINSLNESGFKITNDLLTRAQKDHLNPKFSVTSFPRDIDQKQLSKQLTSAIKNAQVEENKHGPTIS